MTAIKMVYLASPLSHPFKEIEKMRYEDINKVAANLHELYPQVAFILPITQSYKLKEYNTNLGTSFEAWKDRDLEFINRSDELWIVTIDGWKESIGVMAELDFALQYQMPIYFIDPATLQKLTMNQFVKKYKKSTTKSRD
jgi:hypothetical protein